MRGSPSLRFNAIKRNGSIEVSVMYLANHRRVNILDTLLDCDEVFAELIVDLQNYRGDVCPRVMAFDYDTKVISYSDGMTTGLFVLSPCDGFEETKAFHLYSRVVSFFSRVGTVHTDDVVVNMMVKKL